MRENVLEMKNLKVVFPIPGGLVRAVEGVDLSVAEGECLALVGESGCGKSVTARAAMKLLDASSAVVRTDTHLLGGKDIRNATEREMEDIRGNAAAMIFQDALAALNPVMTVGRQIDEIFFRHLKLSKAEAKERSIAAMASVGVPDPASRYRAYPHELSGGMRQRVLIAMAFACEPRLILADEPTTALDVTIQAQVLELLDRMRREHHTALLLISHDLSVVSAMADRVSVMYSGKIVETAPKKELFANPVHPYTRGLLDSVVRMEDTAKRFSQIPGALPNPVEKCAGCYFHPRCAYADERCRKTMPRLETISDTHLVRCLRKAADQKLQGGSR